MADTNKETLAQKLTNIADGFRTSRSLTSKLSLEDMAELAAVPITSGENKLAQLFNKTIAELTAEDTQGATGIADYLFENCYDLKTVNLAEGIWYIKEGAFSFCHNLERITLPSTLTSFWDETLMGCWALEELRLPEGLTKLPNTTLYQGTGYKSKTGEFNVYLPSTITSVGYSQFGYSSSYDKPSEPLIDVINIHFAAQQGVDAWFKQSDIGRPVPKLRIYLNGQRINNITLPSTITSIGNGKFAEGLDVDVICEGNIKQISTGSCRGIKTISFPNNTTIPTLSDTTSLPTFDTNILEEIRVPAALYDSWKVATNWANYADYIVVI